MDQIDADRMWGAITALNHILEHTWALTLAGSDDPEADIANVRSRMLREFDMPRDDAPSDEGFRASQHALSTLEDFWDRVAFRASLPRTP